MKLAYFLQVGMLILLVVNFLKNKENVMMHHHSSVGKVLCFVSSLILSLAAIAIGLLALNYNVLTMPYVQAHLSSLIYPTEIIVGIIGVIALFFTLFGGMIADRCECCTKHDAAHKHHESGHKH